MQTLPFDLKVLVYTRPNLRSDNLEYEMYLGRNLLDNIFGENPRPFSDAVLMLSFPERWLNILEQRALLERLVHYGHNLREVIIKTHSVFIIQATPNGCLAICDPGASAEIDAQADDHTRCLWRSTASTDWIHADRLNVL